MKTHLRQQVVILGGGFAGLAAALELARLRGRQQDYNVILVDQNCYHLYHGLLYEVATAGYSVKPLDLEYLHGGVCIRLKALGELVTKRRVDFVQATVTGLERQRQRVVCQDQADLVYSHLVIALGAQPADFGIPGLAKYSLPLGTIPDALAIRQRLQDLVAAQRSQPHPVPKKIVIAGGGFTGVETAGEILHYLRRLERRGQLVPGSIRLQIVEGGATVLQALGPATSARAERRLRSLGAQLTFNTRITGITPQAITLASAQSVAYDLLLWGGGIQANQLIRSFGLPLAGRGQLAVEPALRVSGTSNIWAAGDCIAFSDPATSQPIPQIAQLAIDAGRVVAQNIFRSTKRKPLKPFVPVHPGFVIPIGGMYAIAQTRWFKLYGFLAWAYRKMVDLNYFTSIMNFRNALRVFIRGARVYLKND
ncbi:MAG: NAD(P)/FAD-dependent oxidoreductase [Candidatus Kerfeldbacteria bacterium]|nr:NAD(P)/FAD-dependent oxidoreductase [Candidatus Kerfeldbacteria bacterium]